MSPKGEQKNEVLSKLLKSSTIVAKEIINLPTVDKDGKLKYEELKLTIKPLNNRKANEIYSVNEGNLSKINYEIVTYSIPELKDLGYEDFKSLGFGVTSQLAGKVLDVSGLQDTEISNKIKNF